MKLVPILIRNGAPAFVSTKCTASVFPSFVARASGVVNGWSNSATKYMAKFPGAPNVTCRAAPITRCLPVSAAEDTSPFGLRNTTAACSVPGNVKRIVAHRSVGTSSTCVWYRFSVAA